jgi:glucosamine--fructose-6-phosphate aminotransferase (isomerizing)
MCGIVGYVGPKQAAPFLLDGLRRLEYRGYDSSGIAVNEAGSFFVARAEGKLSALFSRLNGSLPSGHTGIGHTRWATHGKPIERNAHPHLSGNRRIAVIHNGIIENFAERKRILQERGQKFLSDTDTEVFAHEVEIHYRGDLFAAVRDARKLLTGAYAVVVASLDEPDVLVTARSGPPIVLGRGEGENFIASDPTAILPWTREVVFLEDGDVARVDSRSIRIVDQDGKEVERPVRTIDWDVIAAEKGGYRHFMAKEIHEQPVAVGESMGGKVSLETGELEFEDDFLSAERVARADRILLLACGTSWHASLVGKFLIERMARIPVEVDYGSEFRYRSPVASSNTIAIGVSQSGETADTVAALQEARRLGAAIGAIVNAPGSQIARMANAVWLTHAGPEIGVASTKAFTTQLLVFFLLAARLRQARGLAKGLSPEETASLSRLPGLMERALRQEPQIQELARMLSHYRDFLYLGRGLHYPIALEGALKLKEISYIHAEGYPAGEMKHGPIALVDENMPVLVLAPRDGWREKTLSNLREVKSRDGRSIVVSTEIDAEIQELADHVVEIPETILELQPIVSVLPLQLFAYHVALLLGCDVDQPRNLAKSVTVE